MTAGTEGAGRCAGWRERIQPVDSIERWRCRAGEISARTAGAQLSSPRWICCWLCCSPPIMLGQSCCCCCLGSGSQATFLPSQILPVWFVTCSGEPCRMFANVIVNRGSCEMRYLTHWHSVQQSRHGGQRSGPQHSIDLHWSDKKLQDKNAILSGQHFLFTCLI